MSGLTSTEGFSMSRLNNDPKIKKLAQQLSVQTNGNAFDSIKEFALKKTVQLLSGFPVDSLDTIRQVLMSRLSVSIETIHDTQDISTIAENFPSFHPRIKSLLRDEFVNKKTEGILLRNRDRQPGDMQYLAVIDARGQKSSRAYFSIWHEIAHLLVAPPQLELDFRRSPSKAEVKKDPIEALVDNIAGVLAFYEPIFLPALEIAIQAEGELNFTAIEKARDTVAPSASLFSAVLASIRLTKSSATFVCLDWKYKKAEERALHSPQLSLLPASISPKPERKLRIDTIIPAESTSGKKLKIYKNMRVPDRSVLYKAETEGLGDETLVAIENQSWWETSTEGPLPSLKIRVIASNFGQRTYGLILPSP